jgi:hypothetical protein
MKTTNLIVQNFWNSRVAFTEQGWINATATCKAFGKNGLDNYLRSKQFIDYAQIVAISLRYDNFMDLIKTKRGQQGETSIHPDLIFDFVHWISPTLAFWCNDRIIKCLGHNQTSPKITAKITQLEHRVKCLEKDQQIVSIPLFTDTRKALELLIKNYATTNQVSVQYLYQLLYEWFTLIYKQKQSQSIVDLDWIENNGFITEAYDLAKQIFKIPNK